MLKSKMPLLTVLMVVGMAIPALEATAVTFRQGEDGYTSSRDTFIQRINGRQEWNQGGAEDMLIQSSGNSLPGTIGIIQYQDIFGPGAGQVPAGHTITNATLRMFLRLEDIFTSAEKTLFVSPALIDVPNYGNKDWEPADVGEASWSFREQAVTDWGVVDGDINNNQNGPVENVDYDISRQVQQGYFLLQENSFIDVDVTSIVSDWSLGAISNFGFMILPDSGGFTAGYFRANDWGTLSERPQLVVNFSAFAAADFNSDGFVDGGDLTQWEGDFGVNANSDADADGDSDGADFLIWQRQFTGPSVVIASSAVPEPSSLLLLLGGWMGLAIGGRKHCRSTANKKG